MPTTDNDNGRDTLPEAIQDALGAVLLRALERHPANSEMVYAAFRNLKFLDHAKLFHLVGPKSHEGGVNAFLVRQGVIAKQYGRLLWEPELLNQDLEAERSGRLLPRPSGAPRLFIGHSWANDQDVDIKVEEFAAWLFNRGYDLVYDRDPRHIEKGLSSDEILALLPSCSQMIAIVTDSYQERIRDPMRTSPACQEFSLAPQLYRLNKQPTLLGLWLQGEELVQPFSAQWVLDCRHDEIFPGQRANSFPVRQFEVVCRQANGSENRIGPMKRLDVRPLVEQLLAEAPGCRLLVRDITNQATKHHDSLAVN